MAVASSLRPPRFPRSWACSIHVWASLNPTRGPGSMTEGLPVCKSTCRSVQRTLSILRRAFCSRALSTPSCTFFCFANLARSSSCFFLYSSSSACTSYMASMSLAHSEDVKIHTSRLCLIFSFCSRIRAMRSASSSSLGFSCRRLRSANPPRRVAQNIPAAPRPS